MANRRYIDFPIASSVGDSDIILIWQSGANKQTTKATFLSGLPENLDELNDVAISGLTNGQILRYDSVTGKWENTDQGNLDLNDLNDVSIVSPSNGQVLVYNSSTSKWENSSGGYVPYTGAVTTVNLGAQTIQAGSFVKAGGTSAQFLKADGSVDSNVYGTGTVTSVALTMPSAFSVANSPITTAGTLAVTGAGTVGQYIRGDGSLADFPESSGGGSSVSYYLNGSVAQGTIGGVAYKELNKVPVLGAGTDFTIAADGYIASFITDAGDPNLLEIPGGNWNFETYFSASSGGGSPTFYVELYKVNSGGTATLLASNSTFPELIAFGTNITAYFSTLAVPTTTLALTDRLAIRYYVTHSGRTITLHTEDNHLCQIITTFTTGLTALNGLTAQVQNFSVGTSGTDFAISSATATHTFNLPTASATNRGALSSTDWTTFNGKQNALTNPVTGTGTTNYLPKFTGASTIGNSLIFDNGSSVGINTATPGNYGLAVDYNGSGLSVVSIKNTSSSGYSGAHLLNNSGGVMGHIGYANASTSAFTDSVFFGSIASKAVIFTTADSEKMRIFSGGNVHIGTIPSSDNGARLQVSGTATISSTLAIGTTMSSQNGGTFAGSSEMAGILRIQGGSGRYFTTGNGLELSSGSIYSYNRATNSYNDLSINDTITVKGGGGNVWIGNDTNPLLEIANGGSTDVLSGIRWAVGGSRVDYGGIYSATSSGNNNYISFYTKNSASAPSERMRITASGNVGIGTANPASERKLTVAGGAQFTFASNSGASFNIIPAANGQDGADFNLSYYTGSAYGPLNFIVGESNKLRINPNGQITVFSNNGIVVGANGRAFIREKTGGDAEIGSPLNGALFLLANGSNVLSFSGGAATFSSLGTGSVTATAGTLSTVSDLSYKIEDGFIDSAIEKVLSLKPRYFYWNEKSGLPTNIRQLGFYAQEVNESLGEEAANTPQNKNTPWGISDRSMIAYLTKAIQELKQEIDTLKN